MKFGASCVGPFSVPPKFADKLKFYSMRTGRSITEVVIAAVNDFIDNDSAEAESVKIWLGQRYAADEPVSTRRTTSRFERDTAPIQMTIEDRFADDPAFPQ